MKMLISKAIALGQNGPQKSHSHPLKPMFAVNPEILGPSGAEIIFAREREMRRRKTRA